MTFLEYFQAAFGLCFGIGFAGILLAIIIWVLSAIQDAIPSESNKRHKEFMKSMDERRADFEKQMKALDDEWWDNFNERYNKK